jgi:Ni,Fe-hydrogenase III large subunit
MERVIAHGDAVAACLRAIDRHGPEHTLGVFLDDVYDALDAAAGTGEPPVGQGFLGLIVPGGVAREVTGLETLATAVLALERDWAKIVPGLRRALPKERAVGVGAVAAEGVSGPAARAAGAPADTRATKPYAAYADLAPDVASATDGDVASRYHVLLDEIGASLQMARQAIERLPEGPIAAAVPARWPDGAAAGTVEAPGGREAITVRIVGNRVADVTIETPARGLLAALPGALVNCALADAGLVVASLELCVGCSDL